MKGEIKMEERKKYTLKECMVNGYSIVVDDEKDFTVVERALGRFAVGLPYEVAIRHLRQDGPICFHFFKKEKRWKYCSVADCKKILKTLVIPFCSIDFEGRDNRTVTGASYLKPNEKQYLQSFLRPYKDRVTWICKAKFDRNNNIRSILNNGGDDKYCFLLIYIKSIKDIKSDYSRGLEEVIALPYFDIDKEFKGLKINHFYEPKGLGLFPEKDEIKI